MLTPEQRAQVVEAMARITSMRYDLGEIEKKLNKFRDVKADPSDPSGIDISDATDILPNVRKSMSDVIDVLDMFARRTKRRGSKMALIVPPMLPEGRKHFDVPSMPASGTRFQQDGVVWELACVRKQRVSVIILLVLLVCIIIQVLHLVSFLWPKSGQSRDGKEFEESK